MPGRIQSPSAQLGELLLRGWCMQAEACSDCQVPLMRDPATMLSHCVGCRRVYNADGVVQEGQQQAPAAPQPSAAAAVDRPSTSQPVGVTGSSSSQPAAAAPLVRANGTTAVPVQQQPPDEDADFVQVQRRYLQMRRRREAATAAAADGSDPSQLLAERLLEGWTMLGQHCPICNSPLMRSRAMQVQCVVCNLPVQMESSTTATPATEQAAQAVPEHPSSTGRAVAAPASVHVHDEEQATAAVAADAGAAPAQPVFVRSAVTRATAAELQRRQERREHPAAAAVVPGGSNLLLQQQRVLSGLQRVLLQKLDDTRQLLAATAATQVDDVAMQLQIINQLMQTFATVKQAMPQ